MRKILLSSLAAVAFTSVAAATGVSRGEPMLMGSVTASSDKQYGMFRFSITEPTKELVKKGVDATGGGTYSEGLYYMQEYMYFPGLMDDPLCTNMIWDAETWELKEGLIGDLSSNAFDLANDPTTGIIYGCFQDPEATGEVCIFGRLDKSTYTTTWICDVYEAFVGMACDSDGHLFALSKEGNLYEIDKVTGARTHIGATGLISEYNSSAAIDPGTGLMYYVLCTSELSSLYTINTTTAEAVKVYDFAHGEEIQGLYFFEPFADDDAPAAATAVSMTFEGPSLSGTIDFTIPTRNYLGDAELTEAVGYTIKAPDGAIYASGSAAPGTEVKAPVTVDKDGKYVFEVSLSNTHGTGPVARTDGYVGYDVPGSISDIKATAEGDNVTLTWGLPAYGLYKGYFNASDLRSRIVRYPDEVVLAEAYEGLSFTDIVDVPEDGRIDYYYTVQAVNGRVIGSAATSNVLGFGIFSVPYEATFTTQADFDRFTPVNANNDAKKWEFNPGNAVCRISFNNNLDMDDWMMSPGVRLEAGKTYVATLIAYAHNDRNTERIALAVGQGIEPADMTQIIIEPTETTALYTAPDELKGTFTVPQTGTYHFGVHGVSDKGKYYLYFKSLKVVEDSTSGIGDAIADDNADAPVRWYNLQGIEVTDPSPGQVYIRRQGTVTAKVRL